MTTTLDQHAAWERAGKPIKGARNIEESLSIAGLNWHVKKVDAKTVLRGKTIKIPSSSLIIKQEEDLPPVPLSIINSKAEIYQNSEIFSFLDDFQKYGFAFFSYGGQFNNGALVWM